MTERYLKGQIDNKSIGGVYRIRAFYLGQCGVCGRQHFTQGHTSEKALTELRDLDWVQYQDALGIWRVRCPDCNAKVDHDPAPESETFDPIVFEDATSTT